MPPTNTVNRVNCDADLNRGAISTKLLFFI